MELSGEVLDAFLLHVADQVRREVAAEFEAMERARWEPIRSHLRSLAETPTWAERKRRQQTSTPWQLKATPGWPPIAIPGQPGKYLTAHQENAA